MSLPEELASYLASKECQPFFCFVDDASYTDIKHQLELYGADMVACSDFCLKPDKRPSLDRLKDSLGSPPCEKEIRVVLGLGEAAALLEPDPSKILRGMRQPIYGHTPTVLLIRGLPSVASVLSSEDLRFDKLRYAKYGGASNIKITRLGPNVSSDDAAENLQSLLKQLEQGATDVKVRTRMPLRDDVFYVEAIDTPFQELQMLPQFKMIQESWGRSEQWSDLLNDVQTRAWTPWGRITREMLDEVADTIVRGNDTEKWRLFLSMKLAEANVESNYLRRAINNMTCSDNMEEPIVDTIIELHPSDSEFAQAMRDRDRLVSYVPDSTLQTFVQRNRRDPETSLYRLRDKTTPEREEIIRWVSEHLDQALNDSLKTVYPALVDYLEPFQITGTPMDDELTEYVNGYIRQKIANKIEPASEQLANAMGLSRPFNRLPSRDALVESFDDGMTYLLWIDAMGIEYLGFLCRQAVRHELIPEYKVGRATIPTITEYNGRAYDNWSGSKNKIDKLDSTKHDLNPGYDLERTKLPIYLGQELCVLTDAIERAADALRRGNCDRVVVASDHGASRLVVLQPHHPPNATKLPGHYAGRCVRVEDAADWARVSNMAHITKEEDWYVSCDRTVFGSGHARGVETHGGGTIEEVVVPVIVLRRQDTCPRVQLMHDTYQLTPGQPCRIELFVDRPSNSLKVAFGGAEYRGQRSDANHYGVIIPELKRAGVHKLSVQVDNINVDDIEVKVTTAGTVNADFDDLF